MVMEPKSALRKISLVAVLAIPAAIVFNNNDRFSKEEVTNNTTTQTPATQNCGLQPEAEVLRQELAEARVRNRELKREILAMRASTPPDRSADDLPPARNELAQPPNFAADDIPYQNERIHPDFEYEMAEAIDTLEMDFWGEEYDSQWSAEVENELVGALKQQIITDTTLDTVQCHSSLCLAEFVHATPEAHDALLQHLGNMTPFFGGFLVKIDESGPDNRTLVYFPRHGETLPLPLNLLTTTEGESS